MDGAELERRLDGRTQRHLAGTLGVSPSIVNHWLRDRRVPEKYVPAIRERYPLPAETPEQTRALFAAGYFQALRDVQLEVGRLRDVFRRADVADGPPARRVPTPSRRAAAKR